MFEEEIQRIGEEIGLQGKFLVDYGIDQIIAAFKSQKAGKERAAQMLKVAAQYIVDNDPERIIYYDEKERDGYCVAEDCEIAAEEL